MMDDLFKLFQPGLVLSAELPDCGGEGGRVVLLFYPSATGIAQQIGNPGHQFLFFKWF